VSAGILFGLITMLVQYVGLFMTGFHTGLLLAAVGAVIAEQTHYVSNPWAIAGILLAGGLLFAICNLYWKKGSYSSYMYCVRPRYRPGLHGSISSLYSIEKTHVYGY